MDVIAWFLSANITAFVCTLKPKQPQPSPTVAGEGADLGKHQASRLKLVPLVCIPLKLPGDCDGGSQLFTVSAFGSSFRPLRGKGGLYGLFQRRRRSANQRRKRARGTIQIALQCNRIRIDDDVHDHLRQTRGE